MNTPKAIKNCLIGTVILSICLVTLLSADAAQSNVEPQGLIAHWTFDEESGNVCVDRSPHRNDAKLGERHGEQLNRVEGVFGKAVYFSGRHTLEVTKKRDFSNLREITLSAWVQPEKLTGYREIFRKEDGDKRILFSFQASGSILSLGLHISGRGYKELDASINPALILDGQWHHVAGVFDGVNMRVYLNGKEIDSLEYPGAIISGGPAPAYIGSSNGGGEFFQGGIDDLRILNKALSASQIAALHSRGVKTLLAQAKKREQQFKEIYVEKPNFAETLAAIRKNIKEKNIRLPRLLAYDLKVRLAARFENEYKQFIEFTGSLPIHYLNAVDNSWNRQHAERLNNLLTEYKPLTESQWARLTSSQRKKWEDIQTLEKEYEQLKAMGEEATFAPEWIDFILQAGKSITYRPVQYEAVAPYIKAYTPETRDLSHEEAVETLKQDWLHQVDSRPTIPAIKNEITWARQIAARIQRNYPGEVNFALEYSNLKILESRTELLNGPDTELYYAIRKVKRSIMFKNPVIDFDKILFVDVPFPHGSEWPHETRHRLGYMAVPGGRLLTLEGLSPKGHVTKLMPQEPLHGTFWRPDLSFDGKKVLFSFKPANEKNFHLYEINVDGTGLRQITDGIYDDVDPIYLPDGEHILFASTRGHNYVRCMPPTNSFVITRCDLTGKNMYIISRNNEPDYLPALLNDGRVIYTRWEYTDKPLWRAQSLWTMNPNGTRPMTFWGNQSVWPDLLKDARPIPGSRRVMFTGSAHHNWFSGSLGIIDPDKGLNFPDGLTKITAELEWPESGNGPADPIESPHYHRSGKYTAYQNAYPLSEQDFLVSAQRNGKFVLYLMDTEGNKELIYEGRHNIFHAIPLTPRKIPHIIPDTVDWPTLAERLNPKDGVIFSDNVYQNAPRELKGKARYLRILTIDSKTYTYWYKRPYASTGPVVSMISSEGVKRILGTVPIEADGSVSFKAPPGQALHFQLLNEDFRALQTMRSFTGVMPGEKRGCLGCHEMHSVTPVSQKQATALKREPSEIVPPPWGDESISYLRFVQPVLDKYCGKCHQGDGEAREKLDLTFRPGFSVFPEPYVLLTGHPTWGRPYQPPKNPAPGFGIADTIMVEAFDPRDPAAYVTPKPMTKLSYKSRLIELASSGKHNDVKVDPVSLRKLIAWVDTMCPYRGDREIREIPDPVFQGIDWLSQRPQIKNAPVVVRPGPMDEKIRW
jgi:concanavalin A-like lectin/glucanase superfamily protein/hydrazine synthase alpha subunit-like protein